MLVIDDRKGSVELAVYVKQLGIPVSVTRLEFGDMCLNGSGPDGDYLVGVERKTLRDALNSMRSHRLSGFQLPGMLDLYDAVYLVVEGIWRPDKEGWIEIHTGREWRRLVLGSSAFRYGELDGFIASLEQCAQVKVRRTGTMMETAMVLADLYKWWKKPWKEHRSVTESYIRAPKTGRRNVSLAHKVPGLVWKMASQLPHIDTKGEEIEKKFGTVRKMVEATVEEWDSIPGISRQGAEAIVRLLNGTVGGTVERSGKK